MPGRIIPRSGPPGAEQARPRSADPIADDSPYEAFSGRFAAADAALAGMLRDGIEAGRFALP